MFFGTLVAEFCSTNRYRTSWNVLHSQARQRRAALPSRAQAADPLQEGHSCRLKDLALLQELLARLQQALKSRNKQKIYAVRDEIEASRRARLRRRQRTQVGARTSRVFLVAIVIAAGVRAYFLQPFKIPTGSMQPTLFGIVGTPTTSRLAEPHLARATTRFCSGVITST